MWGGTPGRVRTCKPVGARELEPRACTDFATGADSPCLLVKGADCAGVCLAVLAWLCPGLSRDARSRVARIELWPRQSRMTTGSSVGPTHSTPRHAFARVTRRWGFPPCDCPRTNRCGGRGTLWLCRARSTYRIVWWLSARNIVPLPMTVKCHTSPRSAVCLRWGRSSVPIRACLSYWNSDSSRSSQEMILFSRSA